MTRFTAIFLSCAVPLLAAAPAAARWTVPPSAALAYPGAPHRVYDDPVQPYAMNYTDEAARTLGLRDGHLAVFETRSSDHSSLAPSFSGGLGSDGAMFKMQWHPGQ